MQIKYSSSFGTAQPANWLAATTNQPTCLIYLRLSRSSTPRKQPWRTCITSRAPQLVLSHRRIGVGVGMGQGHYYTSDEPAQDSLLRVTAPTVCKEVANGPLGVMIVDIDSGAAWFGF